MHCVQISPQFGHNQATERAYCGRRHQHSSHKSPENLGFGTEIHLFIIMLEEIRSYRVRNVMSGLINASKPANNSNL